MQDRPFLTVLSRFLRLDWSGMGVTGRQVGVDLAPWGGGMEP